MTNTGIYQWFCLWRWCKMYNPGCVFIFFCVFLPQRQGNFVKMPLPPRMHLWEPMCLFPQRRVFFTRWLVLPTTWPLECHTVETSYHAQHVWISMPTADTQTYLFWLRAEWLWNISFHFRPAAVNGACVNTQGSVSKSFCALEFPSTMVYKENVSHGTLLLPLGSRVHHLSTSKKIFHLGFYPQKQMLRQL